MSYHCRECGKVAEAYAVKCAGCGAGNSFVSGIPRDGGWIKATGGAVLIQNVDRKDVDRITTGTRELDRVLNGGFGLEGTYILSGSPGAGKSTLVLQILIDLADAEVDKDDDPWVCLYVIAEEMKEQVAARGDRILPELRDKKNIKIYLVNENDVLEVEKLMVMLDPDIVVVDSAQTMKIGDLDAPAGSVTAIRAVGIYLCGLSKAKRSCLIMVSHVTKEEDLAGPKSFEHLVDGVMHLSNEEPFRVLRMSKHRFGPTSEVGIFVMKGNGLRSLENPSELLLEAHVEGVPGSVIAIVADDKADAQRALLCEVQALHVPGEGYLKQSVTGLDAMRVRQLVAVLMTRLGARLEGETFVSVAGGLRPKDAGLDLPIALAMLSSALGEEMPENFACFGEVGLAGEIRMPKSAEGRVKSAMAMHVDVLMTPPLDEIDVGEDVEHVEVRTIYDAVKWLDWDVGPQKTKKSKRGKVRKS